MTPFSSVVGTSSLQFRRRYSNTLATYLSNIFWTGSTTRWTKRHTCNSDSLCFNVVWLTKNHMFCSKLTLLSNPITICWLKQLDWKSHTSAQLSDCNNSQTVWIHSTYRAVYQCGYLVLPLAKPGLDVGLPPKVLPIVEDHAWPTDGGWRRHG